MACLESSFPEYSILKTSPLGDELDVGECGWYWRIALDHRAALYWRARPDNSLYPKEKGGSASIREQLWKKGKHYHKLQIGISMVSVFRDGLCNAMLWKLL